ncbi:MAG: LLM class flavin-dependent oxidoreductase [Hyphomicrobiaceae bacterium]|nr:LLM class flavin-dependent oxidoreductase [Hyphomicrobiaceae bacterium]
MRFGLFGGARSRGEGPEGDSLGYRHYIDYVLTAEELGFHSVFVVEHHFTGVGQVSASLNLLSYLAARTSRIRLGTAVVVLPWHNPALLAEQVSTLDLLSGGRVDLGVGKGYRASEFAGFSVPMEEAAERFDEAMAFLRKAWTTDGRFSHNGKRWRFDDVLIEPRPVQRPHPPFWLGAGSPQSIRRAAEEDFCLLLDQVAPVEVIAGRVRLYKEALAAAGRKDRPHRIAVARGLQLVRSESERVDALEVRARVLRTIGGLARGPGAERYHNLSGEAAVALAGEEAALLGTPDEIVARLRKLEAGGVDYVLLVDPTGSLETLRSFASEIMPQFTEA